MWRQRGTAQVNGDPEAIGNGGAPVAQLEARAKRGDVEAFALLYRRYLDDVYGFVAARLSDRQAAEDATQTIFFRAIQSLHSCRDDAAFPGWLFAIARNVVADTYRPHRLRPETWDDAFDREDPAATPEEVAVQRDDARMLAEARQRCLSGPERELTVDEAVSILVPGTSVMMLNIGDEPLVLLRLRVTSLEDETAGRIFGQEALS